MNQYILVAVDFKKLQKYNWMESLYYLARTGGSGRDACEAAARGLRGVDVAR